VTNRTALWGLLTQRLGEWISRDNIDFVGGGDAARRMRELREAVLNSGTHRLEERRGKDGRFEYRLLEIPVEQVRVNERRFWRCVKCGSPPMDFAQTMAAMDERWRMGRCSVCHADKAIFGRAQ
jgi:hypothetical protein